MSIGKMGGGLLDLELRTSQNLWSLKKSNERLVVKAR
jgi:hypothetical protein